MSQDVLEKLKRLMGAENFERQTKEAEERFARSYEETLTFQPITDTEAGSVEQAEPAYPKGFDDDSNKTGDELEGAHSTAVKKGKGKEVSTLDRPNPATVLPTEPNPTEAGESVTDPARIQEASVLSLEEILSSKKTAREKDTRQRGELGPAGKYCPIVTVAKFPYKYMVAGSERSEAVSKKFFAGERFWKRLWSIHYIYPPIALGDKPLLLVPAEEVQKLFDQINLVFDYAVGFTSNSSSQGFLSNFEADGNPLPRFLGLSDSREMFRSLEHDVPPPSYRPPGEEEPGSHGKGDRSYEAWKKTMERAIAVTKQRQKISREKRRQQRILVKTDWTRKLRRAQGYLGLRSTNTAESKGALSNASADEHEFILNQRAMAAMEGVHVPNIKLDLPAPHPFDSNVIFISIDVEAYERSHKLVTEIGIAILDTRDLKDMAPGKGGATWMALVKGRHFIIKEYEHLVNSKFVSGCPDSYESEFGFSEHISVKDAPAIVAQCFRSPQTIKPGRHHEQEIASPDSRHDDLSTSTSGTSTATTSIGERMAQIALEKNTGRKIVLVGHDTKTDVEFLRSIGFNLLNLSTLLEILDTAELYRSYKQEEQASSLSSILYNLGIENWNLHNAGNDAAYTLQAFVGIVVSSLANGDEPSEGEEEDRIAKAEQEAAERTKASMEEWKVVKAKERFGDGGAPPGTSAARDYQARREAKMRARMAKRGENLAGSSMTLTSDDEVAGPAQAARREASDDNSCADGKDDECAVADDDDDDDDPQPPQSSGQESSGSGVNVIDFATRGDSSHSHA